MSRLQLGSALLATLLLAACHAPPGIENQPLGAVAANPERRTLDLADRDRRDAGGPPRLLRRGGAQALRVPDLDRHPQSR